MNIEVSVFHGKSEIWKGISKTPLEIGRQQDGDADPPNLRTGVSNSRLVIAQASARSIPRQALRVDVSEESEICVTNIHSQLSFYVGEHAQVLGPGQQFKAKTAITVLLAEDRTLRLTAATNDWSAPYRDSDDLHFKTIQVGFEATGEGSCPAGLNEILLGKSREDQAHVAVDLVRSALTVVQAAAGSDQFFDSAASAVATMIDLDRALVLLREGEEWKVRSCFQRGDTISSAKATDYPESISRGLTDEVLRTGKTVLYDPVHHIDNPRESILVLDRAVAAPIFDENRNVIGAIYGDRRRGSRGIDTPIGDLEAALLEVMAGAVSSGIARQREETIRASLTQFFSPAVLQRLEKNEDLLAGRDAEVTVMFCDIRGFSTIAEQVGAKRTIEWINDVLTELSHCVIRTDGVLVDYIGDELMAMWGAPAEMPDHAARACRSAVQMLGLIEPLRQRWDTITPDKFSVGIGINTGIARVGNTGSKLKFKYGPLGNMVNVASRAEGMTKILGVSALITDTTAQAIDQKFDHGFDHRRLALARMFGIQEPVLLHELKRAADDDWRSMARRYESALASFDTGNLTLAARQLASLVYDHPDDNPSVVLLGRVVDALTRHEDKVDPVWNMQTK